MQYRELGRTRLKVSEIGFGALEIGRDWGIEVPGDFGRPQEKQAIRLVEEAVELGINFFDTAPAYQLSEERLGKALKGKRQSVCLATKVGEHYNDDRGFWYDYGPEAVRRSLEQSLRRLQSDYVDLLQIHSASREVIENRGTTDEIQRLRQQGYVRFVGMSGDVDGARAALLDGRFDTIQVTYNLLDRAMEQEVFARAVADNVGIIVMQPLAQGVLTAKAAHLPSDRAGDLKKAEQLRWLVRDDQTLAQAALRWVLANDAVDTIIAGTRKSENLQSNVAASMERLSHEDLTRIDELYARDFSVSAP